MQWSILELILFVLAFMAGYYGVSNFLATQRPI
jgi:hypothetical protein